MTEAAGAEGNESLGCIKPEISHFPDPLISKRTRQHGAVILHILLAVYVFIGEMAADLCTMFDLRVFVSVETPCGQASQFQVETTCLAWFCRQNIK